MQNEIQMPTKDDWVFARSHWREERTRAKYTLVFLVTILALGLVFYVLVRKSQVESQKNYTPVETVSISNMQLLQSNGK